MTASKLPKGWSVENLGLISTVQFTSPYGGTLTWYDGQWTLGGRNATGLPARGLPKAKTMAEARRIGTEFIIKTEDDA